MLCDEAIKKPYRPIVLGIYGNLNDKYHLMYDAVELEVSHIMGRGEFNEKLFKLFNYLDRYNINRNRPFIIIGNYNPTGESLTYVNYKYGTVRSIIRLLSTTPEENYQSASRINYMTTKFIQNDPDWVMPEKYLIGPKTFIEDVHTYERINDDRIRFMEENNRLPIEVFDEDEPYNNVKPRQTSTGRTAIPMRIGIIDPTNTRVQRMYEIMNIPNKNSIEKREFITILKQLLDENECDITDHTGKFKWDSMQLINFRTYKNKGTNPKKGYWKFNNYQAHFNSKTPFINSTNDINENECEILTCLDNYILMSEPTDGSLPTQIERNFRNIWWMGYKY
jgi:hypothetical protein